MSLKPEELHEIRERWEDHTSDVGMLVEEIFRLRTVLERVGSVCGPDDRLFVQIVKEALS